MLSEHGKSMVESRLADAIFRVTGRKTYNDALAVVRHVFEHLMYECDVREDDLNAAILSVSEQMGGE